jgi:hypothetical protein
MCSVKGISGPMVELPPPATGGLTSRDFFAYLKATDPKVEDPVVGFGSVGICR